MVERIVNNTRISNLDELVLFELKEYEKTLQDAYKGGLSSPYEALQDLERWTILRAVFFSSTVITTIGKLIYANVCGTLSSEHYQCLALTNILSANKTEATLSKRLRV